MPSVVAIPQGGPAVLDTWHTLGLRGTGSHDAVADEVFVPATRMFSLFDGPVLDRPLYRFPVFGFFALSIGAAALGNARGAIDEFVALAARKVGLGSSRTLAERTPTHASVAEAEASLRAARAAYYEAIDAAWQAAQDDQPVSVDLRNGLRLAATHAVRTSADVVRSMYDLGGGTAIYDDSPLQRRFRDAYTATAHFQVNAASRELPGTAPARAARRHRHAVSRRVEGVLPFWLDRPDEEALDIALEVSAPGSGRFGSARWRRSTQSRWQRRSDIARPGLRLKIGPLAVGVRSPVSMALAASSVATLTGSEVGLALGASSPVIVSGWHDRDWAHSASRMRETVDCLREILAGERSDYDGRHVRTHGFRLRRPQPDMRISVAAFGPAMTRVAARHADEVVLNLVPPEHVGAVRATVDAEAAAAGRRRPGLAVWVPVALEPGERARAQLAAQLAVYLGVPGYGEMFSALGFSELVGRARQGARRSELARSCRSSCSSRSAPSARSRRSPRASAPTTTPAPTSSASCRPPPRIPAARAALSRCPSLQRSSKGDCVVTLVNAQCRLAARPVGLPKASDWDYVEEPAPEPGDGQFRVEVEYISLDPAMRGG